MMVRKELSKAYWWLSSLFIYNKLAENIFFSKGYPKKINGETILVPFRFSRYYASVYEPEKTGFIKNICKPGDTVIDVGAHIGIFSCIMAKMVGNQGSVYSFEPAPFTFDILKQTISYNKLENIIIPQQAIVSDVDEGADFYIYDNSKISNGNSISMHNTSGKTKKIKVQSITLDDLLANKNIKNLPLIKIDAEGSEFNILKGAKNLIKKFKPFITLELHPKSFDDPKKILQQMYEFIKDLDYTILFNNKQILKEEFSAFTNYVEVILQPAIADL